MCFVLYIGTRTEAPRIPWHEKLVGISTAEVVERDHAGKEKFALPVVTYVGSDQGCGCGFRHVLFEGGGWPNEHLTGLQEDTQQNHDALIAFIRQHFATEPFVELYGCWDGDFAEPLASEIDLALSRVADPVFCFRERGYYKVRLDG